MSSFLMQQESLGSIANWIYFENDTTGTYRRCKDLAKEYLKKKYKKDFDEYSSNWDEIFAKDLYKLNCYALNKRYGDKIDDCDKFNYKSHNIDIMQMLKSVQCFIYQTSEGDTIKKPLYKLMVKIEGGLSDAIITKLPEYKKAKWD